MYKYYLFNNYLLNIEINECIYKLKFNYFVRIILVKLFCWF